MLKNSHLEQSRSLHSLFFLSLVRVLSWEHTESFPVSQPLFFLTEPGRSAWEGGGSLVDSGV